MKTNAVLLILFLILTLPSFAQDRTSGHNFATRSEIIAQNGMVATSQPLATQAALEVLRNGGNAIDAAITANAVLGVVEPQSNGIGGDLFAIVWDAETKQLYGLNASGRSPYNMSINDIKAKGLTKIPLFGPLSISVPGCVDGWYTLHERFGSLEMQELLQPAIDYAKNGYPVSEIIANDWKAVADRLNDQKGFQRVFAPNGQAPAKGDIFRNPALATTLSKIAEEGKSAFYKGELMKEMVAFLKDQGSYLSEQDFIDHTSDWVEPVSSNYRGYDVWELPPNGQGIAALQILNILEQYDLQSMGFGSAEYFHVFTEAKKLAYEDRAKFYADPEFNEIPVDYLISKEYANQRKELINLEEAADSYPAGEAIETGNTIYLTVADKDGNMISLIQSIYWEFGSGVVNPDHGFAFQNRGEMFTLEEGHFNQYEPHKRPFHTIIPAFVTKNGQPYMSFGVMGGAMQPQGHAQIVVNMVDFGMNLQEAGDAPRIRHMGSSSPTGSKMTGGGTIILESGIDYDVVKALMKKGHRIGFGSGSYGGYQAIMWDAQRKIYFGASDSRKDGQAAGW
ncbi:gamma-glutamyltransferase [Portibacter marinus]|uniref:gamma-glutamyltransferase n=1 Tax=Portibacter marinus TaxID=2898660 RepID=UPI001F22FD28|nr:gamma-glutamyltransferase [Portibacter marinus]